MSSLFAPAMPDRCEGSDGWVCHVCGEAYGTWLEAMFIGEVSDG